MAQSVGIRYVSVIASYNWVDEEKPTIIVPGRAPLWNPPAWAPELAPDSGMQFIDQNGHRVPEAPAEPQVRAIIQCNPGFSFEDYNILADRRPMSCILNMDYDHAPFAFHAQVIGKTVILTRKEEKCIQVIDGFKGFRRNFEQTYLKRPEFPKKVTSYRRIVAYQLGRLNILLHHAVDGLKLRPLDSADETDDREGLLDNTPQESITSLLKGGKEMRKEVGIELATRNVNRPYNYAQKLPDLWLAQTDDFVVARGTYRHDQDGNCVGGTFHPEDIEWYHSREDTEQWEKDYQGDIHQFHVRLQALLREIRDLSTGYEAEKFVVVREEGGDLLEVLRDPYGPGLPEDLHRHFL